MSAKARPMGRQSGFTLVELLIVVAIIGVLSTVGVPTFRRMIQKSRKTEAKVGLGGIYTAEQAFMSEYGGYGNNLARMGFQLDGDPNSLTYVIGFYNATCVPVLNGTGAAAASFMPLGTNAIGLAINSSYQPYYQAGAFGTLPVPQSAGGNVNSANVYATFSITSPAPNANARLTTQCTPGGVNLNVTSTGTGHANAFTAGATGVIAPGISKTAPTVATDTDFWTITDGRLLVNNQDGVH